MGQLEWQEVATKVRILFNLSAKPRLIATKNEQQQQQATCNKFGLSEIIKFDSGCQRGWPSFYLPALFSMPSALCSVVSVHHLGRQVGQLVK